MIITAQMMHDGRALCTVSINPGQLTLGIQQAVGRLLHTADRHADLNWDHIEIYVNRWANDKDAK